MIKLPRESEEDGLLFSNDDTLFQAVIRASRPCAISFIADTCGVCHKHFHECEEEKCSHDDPPFTKANTFFACPGARMRQALVRYEEKNND